MTGAGGLCTCACMRAGATTVPGSQRGSARSTMVVHWASSPGPASHQATDSMSVSASNAIHACLCVTLCIIMQHHIYVYSMVLLHPQHRCMPALPAHACAACAPPWLTHLQPSSLPRQEVSALRVSTTAACSPCSTGRTAAAVRPYEAERHSCHSCVRTQVHAAGHMSKRHTIPALAAAAAPDMCAQTRFTSEICASHAWLKHMGTMQRP